MSERLAVVVCVQRPARAKSRLAPPFEAEARSALVRAMLTDMLAAIRAVHRGPLLLVTPDDDYEAEATGAGATLLRDEGIGYNQAVLLALDSPEVRAGEGVLVLPGDLPQLRPDDVRRLLDALVATPPPAMLLVASDDGGTAALGLRPPRAVAPVFGADSAARHRARAHALGLRLVEPPSAALAVDVDTLEDLLEVRDQVGPATEEALTSLALPALEESR